MSLTEYARRTLEAAARRPSREELVAELAQIELAPQARAPATALSHVRDEQA